ncbi:membrane protein insertion efficiency factor YidD [Otariodibacter sp.]|uniref:membrane protein insertion efficiency factor YidD n=1 Tax=Otariodibacter sp. TaxID=3030919 RepID=UPI00262703E8|nr:membrane protein insertion efficiency factor YidD [Otariodibacter sp.]
MIWFSIQLILLYQRLAPHKIRDACRFEPTCSNYAIIVLKKYGFLKGWRMTFNRLSRCKYPNGGIDEP